MNIAVVTGAGRGLGREIAERLAAEGFGVVATDLDAQSAAETARRIGSSAWSHQHDVRDPDAHTSIAEAATERGELTLWVNNAGVLRAGLAWEMSPDEVKFQTEINFYGLIWGCQAAVAAMRDYGGHIINIASISSIIPAPGVAVYGATKHAVLGYSLSLAGDLKSEGIPISVSTLCPDAIDTAMTQDVKHMKETDLLFSSSSMLQTEDVASVVVGIARKPKLVTVYPATRGFLAQATRPFPGAVLAVLRQFKKIGARNRAKSA